MRRASELESFCLFLLSSLLGVFLFGFGYFFWLVGFHHRFCFSLYGLLTLVLMFLGGHFVGGVGDLGIGSLDVGPSILIVWAWTCPASGTLILCLTLIVAMTFILSNATL